MKNKKKKKNNILLPIISAIVIAMAFIAMLIFIGILKPDEILQKLNHQEETEEALSESTDEDTGISETSNSDETQASAIVEEDDDTTIIFTGDVELSEYVQANYDASGIDGVIAEDLRTELSDADILAINNEFAFSTRGEKAQDKQYTFRVNPSYVSILTAMGVDVAGLANNHVLDYGKDALLDTFTTLSDAGIQYTGAGTSVDDAAKLVVIENGEKKYGFLAASHVIPFGSWNVENSTPGVYTAYDVTDLCNRITEAKKSCDYLYVMIHWGTEHTDELTSYQQNDAHKLIDAGADGVIGSHPHCLQGTEYYNGKPIFYSLGNFIFNTSIASTCAVKITIDGDNEPVVSLIPAYAEGATTKKASETKAAEIYNYLNSISYHDQISEDGILLPME